MRAESSGVMGFTYLPGIYASGGTHAHARSASITLGKAVPGCGGGCVQGVADSPL